MGFARRGACMALVVAMLVSSSLALAAEPTAADIETATTLYNDGRELREKGKTNDALPKLKAAHALVPTPVISLELARAYVDLGKLVDAREVLANVAAIPRRTKETPKSLDARAAADKLAKDLNARIPKLTVKIGSALAGRPLTVDGVEVSAEVAASPRPYDPGQHV